MSDRDKISCRTPSGGKPTAIPSWKYEAVREVIVQLLGAAGSEGFAFKDLPDAVSALLAPELKEKLGSIAWHLTTVKLEMEVAGELSRVPGASPQRLRLTAQRP